MTILDEGVKLKRIFEPCRISKMELRNRLVMPPMVTNYAAIDGAVTEQLKDYYEARARGGVGLVIVEATTVDRAGKGLKNQLGLHDDRLTAGVTELARAVRQHGAKIAIQLHHAGLNARREVAGRGPVGPSLVATPNHESPRPLSVEDIHEITERFVAAAKRAKQAGFDGVEIHGAHGYLLANFLSSYLNRRVDEYGGAIENRARFLIETILATKKALGDDYPVWCRINGGEIGQQAGITSEDAREIARLVQGAGAAAISVSGFSFGVNPRSRPPMGLGPGYFAAYAENVKKGVTIPVIAVGGLDAQSAESMLTAGTADLIALGRALLADPELPNKARAGRLSEIRPCIRCNSCIDGVGIPGLPVHCTVNGTLGKERVSEIGKAKAGKKVLVVGGGPAGMEAAKVAALRGHEVTLYEKEHELGGQMVPGSVPPFKANIKRFLGYQASQLEAAGVRVVSGVEAAVVSVLEAKPDAVIVATGGTTFVPEIAGIDRPNVVRAVDVLSGQAEVGRRVVFVGAELVACESAELLAERGKKVTLLRRGRELATNVNASARDHLLARLAMKGVEAITGVRYEEITAEGILITTADGEHTTIAADSIVLATGARANSALAEALQGRIAEVIVVGDAAQPRDIRAAVAEGYEAGLKV